MIHNAVIHCRTIPDRPCELRARVLRDALEECGYERRWEEQDFDSDQRTDVAGVYRLKEHRFVITVRGPADRREELAALLEGSTVFADPVEGGSVVEDIWVEPDPRSQMDVR